MQVNKKKGKKGTCKEANMCQSTDITWAIRCGQDREETRINYKIHSVQQIKKQLTEIPYFGEAQLFPLITYTDNDNFIIL